MKAIAKRVYSQFAERILPSTKVMKILLWWHLCPILCSEVMMLRKN
ncbi:hypothetical protein HMPREF3034_01891 [Prevotella sp. DNF00663]|nr:hypothetical protein HMPREF3034_01891 [Prevotella sp. DNF00663]